MANKKYLVELTDDERAHLSGLIKKGNADSTFHRNSLVETKE